MWFVNHFKNDQVTHVISLSVVIWSSMLGNIQPGPYPGISPGEVAELLNKRKTKQTQKFCMFSRNVSLTMI